VDIHNQESKQNCKQFMIWQNYSIKVNKINTSSKTNLVDVFGNYAIIVV